VNKLTNVSQGGGVATHLKCGGTLNNDVIVSLLMNLSVKEV